MTQANPPGLGDITTQTAQAQSALAGLVGPAQQAADAIDQAFSKAADSLAKSLGKAASDGKVSLGELASAVIAAVDSAAGVSGGLGGAIGNVLEGLFSGAKADGGPVTAGGAYLVGERGPEVFTPASAGDIGQPGGGGVTVNLNLPAGTDARGLVRSDAQLAQALARAVSLGARRH